MNSVIIIYLTFNMGTRRKQINWLMIELLRERVPRWVRWVRWDGDVFAACPTKLKGKHVKEL